MTTALLTKPSELREPRTGWRDAASCNSDTAGMFDGEDPRTTAVAIERFCTGCPVRVECFLASFRSRKSRTFPETGVWGGFNETERTNWLRRQRKMASETRRAAGEPSRYPARDALREMRQAVSDAA